MEHIILLNGIKWNIRLMMISYKVDVDTQHALIKPNCTFLEEVTCTVENDKLENVQIKFWYMIPSIEP